MVARPTTLTRPITVGTIIEGEVEGEGDVRQEEDEDHPMAEMTMARDEGGAEEEEGADLTAAGADLTLISLTRMQQEEEAEEQAQAVQGTTLF